MTLAAALLAAALFLLCWRRSGIYPLAMSALGALRDAAAAMRDASQDDLVKERLVRQYAVSMLGITARLLVRTALAAAAPALLLLALDVMRLAEFGAVVALMGSWWFIAAASAGALALWAVRR